MTDQPLRMHPLRTSWRQAVVTVIGMSVAVGLVALIVPKPGPLVLAAVLAMTMSRSRLVRTWRGRAEAVLLLPFVALATAGVGYLLLSLPIIGAIAYIVAMFLSIYLRRFGPLGTRIGSLIALPFITLLITPGGGGADIGPLGVALLSVVVLVIVVALRMLADVTRLLPRPVMAPVAPGAAEDAKPASRSRQSMRPIASTRMAIQMAIALAAAFVVGALVFPQHVTWVVLTAFIVCSGNRGRADVLYKSGLRIVGAAAGTVVASVGLIWLTPAHPLLSGSILVVVLLAVLGVGLWLREWTYAAWAVVMTLVITLLQGAAIPAQGTGGEQLWVRIVAIIVGAACGLAASWFVLPVRSGNVVRRRIADALAAIAAFAAAPNPVTDHELTSTLERLDEVAKPWRALERATGWRGAGLRSTGWRATHRKPGHWMQLVHECATLVRARPQLSGVARRALGDARRSIRDPDAIGAALLALRDALRADHSTDHSTYP